MELHSRVALFVQLYVVSTYQEYFIISVSNKIMIAKRMPKTREDS